MQISSPIPRILSWVSESLIEGESVAVGGSKLCHVLTPVFSVWLLRHSHVSPSIQAEVIPG